MRTYSVPCPTPELRRRAGTGPGQAGFSLIEGLIAAALLLVIAVGILPVFTRSLESNISGGRSSQMSTFAVASIEDDNQTSIDRADWSVAGTGVVNIDQEFWVAGKLFDSELVPYTLGPVTQRWLGPGVAPTAADGQVFWSRDVSIRKYSLSDLQIVAGTDVSDDVIVAVGNPMLLDTPLTDDQNGHLVELRVTLKEVRNGVPVASGRRLTTSHYRTF